MIYVIEFDPGPPPIKHVPCEIIDTRRTGDIEEPDEEKKEGAE